MLQVAELKGEMYTTLKAIKTKEDVPKLARLAASLTEKLSEGVDRLKKLGPFDDEARMTLWSIHATREYELIGHELMPDVMGRIPVDAREETMKAMQKLMPVLEPAGEAFEQIISNHKHEGPLRGRAYVELEKPYVASITSQHAKEDVDGPANALIFNIEAEKRNAQGGFESATTLFEQMIPWDAELPSDKDLEEWITYSGDKREVTFTHPKGTFTHKLPAKS